MEGAFHTVADDLAAVTEVRTEVLAVPFHQVQVAGFVAPGHQFLAEVLQGSGLTGREFG